MLVLRTFEKKVVCGFFPNHAQQPGDHRGPVESGSHFPSLGARPGELHRRERGERKAEVLKRSRQPGATGPT